MTKHKETTVHKCFQQQPSSEGVRRDTHNGFNIFVHQLLLVCPLLLLPVSLLTPEEDFFVGTGSAHVLFPCILLHWWVHFPRPVLLYPANTVKSESHSVINKHLQRNREIWLARGHYSWLTILFDHGNLFLVYWAIQVGLLSPLTFARHRLSPLAAFTSGAYFLHNGRRWQWICEFFTANFKGIFGGP